MKRGAPAEPASSWFGSENLSEAATRQSTGHGALDRKAIDQSGFVNAVLTSIGLPAMAAFNLKARSLPYEIMNYTLTMLAIA